MTMNCDYKKSALFVGLLFVAGNAIAATKLAKSTEPSDEAKTEVQGSLTFPRATVDLDDAKAGESPIHKGTLFAEGSLNFSSTSYSDSSSSTSSFTLFAPFQKFFTDNLAAGGDFYYRSTSTGSASTSRWYLGPIASYFFYKTDRDAVAVKESLNFAHSSKGNGYFFSDTSLDYYFFLNRYVAVSPGMTFEWVFGNDKILTSKTISMNLGFAAFF